MDHHRGIGRDRGIKPLARLLSPASQDTDPDTLRLRNRLCIIKPHDLEGDLVMEGLFLLTGAALISASHLINRQLCRQCVACSKGGVENQ